jgi:prepilin-type processing-associated H-X9-DG protein
MNNLYQIGSAMRNYHDAYGRFPPAYLADKNGRPMHSWRVLLLPFLECEDTYKAYRFDEPCDSPHNRALTDSAEVRKMFACHSDRHARGEPDDWETNYVMIVGPGTISDGPNSVRLGDITDGSANTIMIVEVAGSGIHWAEPRDLKADEIGYRTNDPDAPGISSRHRGGAHVLFCDGSVWLLKDSLDPTTVKALTTIAGGEDMKAFMENNR